MRVVTTRKRLKFYFFKNGRKVIKQEIEQLKVNELNIIMCLSCVSGGQECLFNAQELLSNSFHTNCTVGSFFHKTMCKYIIEISKASNMSIYPKKIMKLILNRVVLCVLLSINVCFY